MPQLPSPPKHKITRRVAGLTLIVLIAAAAAAAWWQLRLFQQAADNRQFATITRLANLDNARGDYAGAVALWTSYASSTPSQSHRYTAYVNAAGQYVAAGQYAQAIDLCHRAEALSGRSYEESEVAATAYSALGQKTPAISYYQSAIRLIPNSVSDKPAEIMVFRQAIQELSAKP